MQSNLSDKFKPGDYVILTYKRSVFAKINDGKIVKVGKNNGPLHIDSQELLSLRKLDVLSTNQGTSFWEDEAVLFHLTELDRLIYDITD